MPSNFFTEYPEPEADVTMPLGGTRAQAVHRLQVGGFGLAAMVLLVGLANIIMDRAQQTEASAVPEAAATIAPAEPSAPKKDPLADAGVVPDLPAEPVAEPHTSTPQAGGDNAAPAQP